MTSQPVAMSITAVNPSAISLLGGNERWRYVGETESPNASIRIFGMRVRAGSLSLSTKQCGDTCMIRIQAMPSSDEVSSMRLEPITVGVTSTSNILVKVLAALALLIVNSIRVLHVLSTRVLG